MFAGFLVELQMVTGTALKLAASVDLSIARIRGIWAQRKDFTKGSHDRIPGGAKRLCRSVQRPRVYHRYLRWLWQLAQTDKATYLFRKVEATHKRLKWSTQRTSRLGSFCSAASPAPTGPALQNTTERHGPATRPTRYTPHRTL
jgi:hypothetical protein